MNQLNQTILEGNIVNDIKVTEPREGFKVGKFTMAVNRNYRNANGETGIEVSYFDCVAEDKETLIVTRKDENMVIMSQSSYDSLMETLHLVSNQ